MTKGTAKTVSLDELKATPPKVKEVRLSDEGLKETVLQIGKREIIVSEADYFSDMRLGQATNDMLNDPLPDDIVQGILLTIYPPLMACSSGDLPNHHEITRMSKEGLNLWIKSARDLNKGESWFKGFESIEKRLQEARDGLSEAEVMEKEAEKKD